MGRWICGVIFLSMMQLTHAQTNQQEIEGGNLSEVEVMGSRTSVSYQQTTRVVSVITGRDLKDLAIHSAGDLLDYLSGVDLRQRGPIGVQADVSIRGGSFDQVMILLNGINVTDPQTGHHSLNLPVDLSAIERVEILEGPGARAYGPNAFSGAINFVTATPDTNRVNADIAGGAHGFMSGGGALALNHKNLKNFITLRGSKSDGYAENTDFKSTNIYYRGMLTNGHHRLDWQTGYLDKSFGAFAFYSPKYPNQYEQNRTFFSSLKYTSEGLIKLTPAIYWRRNHDRFELFRNNPASWYSSHNYHMTDVFGASVNGAVKWVGGHTSVGGEVRGESIFSNNLGDPLGTPVEVPGEDDEWFNKSFQRTNSSLFLEHTWSHKGFTISAGMLANHNTGLDYRFRYFPGIDAAYWLTPHLKITAGYNHSLRMPTFTDLFYNTSAAQGNRSLKPEEVKAIESGLRWHSPAIESRITGFYRYSTQLIDWGRTSADQKYQSVNISEMNTTGIQVYLSLTPKEWVRFLTPIKKINIDYLHLQQDKESDATYDSRYVMDYLRNKLVVGLTHQVISRVTASWNASWIDRMGTYTDGADQPQSYASYWLCDLRLTWSSTMVDIYTEASNLFDQSYEDIGNIPQPGRWIRGGIKLKLEW